MLQLSMAVISNDHTMVIEPGKRQGDVTATVANIGIYVATPPALKTHLSSTFWSRSVREFSMRKMSISSAENERAMVLSD